MFVVIVYTLSIIRTIFEMWMVLFPLFVLSTYCLFYII